MHIKTLLPLLLFPAMLFAQKTGNRTAATANAATGGLRVGIKITYCQPGEQFAFSIGNGPQIQVTAANRIFYFPGNVTTGQQVGLNSFGGPRNVTIPQPFMTVGTTDLIYYVATGSAPGTSIIQGVIEGPEGSKVTLQNNGRDNQVITLRRGTNRFFFPTPLPDGAAYRVTATGQSGQLYNVTTYAGQPNIVSPESFVKINGDYQTDLVTRDSANNTGTFYESWDPMIVKNGLGTEGQVVVFGSQARGLCGSTGQNRQLYWRNRTTGETRLITRGINGEEGNGNSFGAVISVSENVVVFESYASNLVPGDNNGARDVFFWRHSNTGQDKIERVSQSAAGVEGNYQSFEPMMSGMGHDVVFTSNASNLLDDNTVLSGQEVYLWNSTTKKITLLSRDPKTGRGVGGCKPVIDMNGYRIAFWSFAYTLVEGDNNNLWDIFLWERNSAGIAQPLRRITMSYTGGERNQGDESSSRVVTPYISGDGKFISYATTASNVVPNDNNGVQDAFVYDIENNTTTRISVNNDGQEGNAASPVGQGERIELSFDGSKAVFTTAATNFGTAAGNVMLYDLQQNKMIPVTNVKGTYVSTPSISRTGKYVVYGCGQPLDPRFNSSGLFCSLIPINQ